ncbi:probable G-protein coupled receptor 19 [Mya arenaria]|uniref:probable G-protein coupled receptor 19 n=1 Tax=Mya arenaria TaxID=6604 RepID=UPI0022E5409E|nr:probable G-protein coupled receptor 19 [Mya arenaria]
MDNASDSDALLVNLNAEKADLMTPVIVFLAVLMCAGLVGNVFVVIYYGFRARKSTHSLFICTVAIYDLISCGISIPFEIVDLRLFITFEDSTACKVLRFVNHFAAIGSICILLEIAIDRFRRICRPVQKQLNHQQAKLACGLSVVVSVVYSWPTFVFYTSVPVDVRSKNGQTVTGHDCTTTKEKEYSVYLLVFNFFYMASFVVVAVILCVLYSLVGRMLVKHNHKMTAAKPTSEGIETSLTDDTTAKTKQTEKVTSNTGDKPTQQANHKTTHLDRTTVKFTMIMLVITVVFVISFLPFLALLLWRVAKGGYIVDALSDSGLVAFQFGLRSYFLNSALNPFTYGFFNSRFRDFLYTMVCVCRRKTSGINVLFSTSSDTQ